VITLGAEPSAGLFKTKQPCGGAVGADDPQNRSIDRPLGAGKFDAELNLDGKAFRPSIAGACLCR